MRISDWSSDVCSSDLSQLCATSGLQTVKRLDNDAFDIVGRGDPGVWIAARAGQFRGMPNIGLRHSQTSKRLLWARFPAKIVKTPSCVACRQAAQRHRHARHRARRGARVELGDIRSEEHTSELQSLIRNSYAVLCLKKKTIINITH